MRRLLALLVMLSVGWPVVAAEGVADSISDIDIRQVVVSSHNLASQRVVSNEALIESVPAIMGERDIVKYVVSLPGVNSTSILDPNFYVRGGGGGENRFLVNGFPVATPQHMSGVMSLFDPFVLHSSVIYKSGYPAQFSGALSSYLNMFPYVGGGDEARFEGEATIGLVASSLRGRASLGERGGDIAVSFRSSYIKRLFEVANWLEPRIAEVPYSFYDATLNYNNRLGRGWSLNIFGLYSDDDLSFDSSDVLSSGWSSYSLSGVARRSGGSSLLTLSAGVWGSGGSGEYDNFQAKDIGSLRRSGRVQAMCDWSLSRRWMASAGGAVEGTNFSYGAAYESVRAMTSTLFGSAKYRSDGALSAELGLNLELYSGRSNSFVAMPRLVVNYLVATPLSLKLDYARTAQYDTPLTMLSLPSPADMVLPLEAGDRPTLCDHLSLGANYSAGLGVNLYGALFYRHFANAKEVASTSFTQSMSQLNGVGEASGAEVEVIWSGRSVSVRANYTYTDAWREFADINSGRRFSPSSDVMHNIAATCDIDLAERWSLSAMWQYSSGQYVTFPVGVVLSRDVVFGGAVLLPVFKDRYNFQLPATHRLDVSADYEAQHLSLSFGAYNIYNQPNISFVAYSVEPYDQYTSKVRPYGINILPIVPYISVTYRW